MPKYSNNGFLLWVGLQVPHLCHHYKQKWTTGESLTTNQLCRPHSDTAGGHLPKISGLRGLSTCPSPAFHSLKPSLGSVHTLRCACSVWRSQKCHSTLRCAGNRPTTPPSNARFSPEHGGAWGSEDGMPSGTAPPRPNTHQSTRFAVRS